MTALADLFPGFESVYAKTSSGRIFARVGGKGPPLLLLHGFPQTHVMWHHLAPALAERFSLVIADLPGYGASDVPRTDADHTPYTKRAMARAMVELMESLGHSRFSLVGHDRGGRVGYRLTLDHPERLSRAVVLDILPTYNYWTNLSRLSALRIYHWTFLAQPHPLPETLISRDPDGYFGPVFAEGFDSRQPAHPMFHWRSLPDPLAKRMRWPQLAQLKPGPGRCAPRQAENATRRNISSGWGSAGRRPDPRQHSWAAAAPWESSASPR